jgi:Trk K+ transport system NAD-binding subunit
VTTQDEFITDDSQLALDRHRRGGYFIVCGTSDLAYRLVCELRDAHQADVVAVVSDRFAGQAPRIADKLDGESVLEASLNGPTALHPEWIEHAAGVALVDADDQTNIRNALRVREINRDVRIVARFYNQRLGNQVQKLLGDCAALSSSATAADAFVNAALDRPAWVQVGDRRVCVKIGSRIDREGFLCVVADRVDKRNLAGMRLMPWDPDPLAFPESTSRRAALEFLDGEPRVSVSRFARLRWRLVDIARFFSVGQLRLVFGISIVTTLVSFGIIWALDRPFGWAAYQTLLDLAGDAVPDVYNAPSASGVGGSWQRIAQLAVTFAGIPMVAVLTAVLVENRGRESRGAPKSPSAGVSNHVVVVGLGNVGMRSAAQLVDWGVPVVGIERNPNARGIAEARALNIPVVVGEGGLDQPLRTAGVHRSRALMAMTGDDAVNLEAALVAREINPEVRLVLRTMEGEFARQVYQTVDNVASRSATFLAAPKFAAALLGREVLGVLSVYASLIVIAQYTVRAGGSLDGHPLSEAEADGGVLVIALKPAGTTGFSWLPDGEHRLVPGDTYVVAASRDAFRRRSGQL